MKPKFFLLFLLIAFASCKKDTTRDRKNITESTLQLEDHQLTYYHSDRNCHTLVVFESGLGDDASPWTTRNIITETLKIADVLLYDRGGYSRSTAGNGARVITTLSDELARVINKVANGRKIILVSHSLGGLIARDYAIKHSTQAAALLFVDPTHEAYNLKTITQELEDTIYNTFKRVYGPAYGGTIESRQLIEDLQYATGLPNLPHIPVTVLSSMKTDAEHSAQDRQQWYDAHELLKKGVSDFVHIPVTNAGHYIQTEQPALVIGELKKLLQKVQ